MRRAFLIGAAAGAAVFAQGVFVFRLLPVRIHVLELWALAWGGVFGLTMSSTFASSAQAAQSLTFAALALMLFYGFAAVALRAAHRFLGRVGVCITAFTVVALHVGLYLWVIRSVVA
jgi:hypothetical protein